MKNQISLQIKTPCNENFNQFSPTPKGGFCNSCEKEVIDFTKMNAQEISSFFQNTETQNTCGRFKNKQLNSFSKKPKSVKLLNLISGIGLACLTLFSFTTAQAQDTKITPIKTAQQQQTTVVNGTILDENNMPLPMANIILKGTTVGTATDFDGNFEFPQKLKKGDILLVSYIGYNTKEITINNENATSKVSLQIDMNLDDVVLMGKVASKKVYSSKRK